VAHRLVRAIENDFKVRRIPGADWRVNAIRNDLGDVSRSTDPRGERLSSEHPVNLADPHKIRDAALTSLVTIAHL
jgi:hypothetical protein